MQNSTLAELNRNIQTLTNSIPGFSVRAGTYNDIRIDGTVYNGWVDYTYIRLQTPGTSTRVICIGFISGSDNPDVWSRYISTNKLIVQKNVDDKWTQFTSI